MNGVTRRLDGEITFGRWTPLKVLFVARESVLQVELCKTEGMVLNHSLVFLITVDSD
jgi:hypothetical protein